MARLFVACVGERDPYWALRAGAVVKYEDLGGDDGSTRDGPILSFFAQRARRADDRVYLLYTAAGPRLRATTHAGGRATAGLLRERLGLPPRQVIASALNQERGDPEFDPADHLSVLRALRERMREIATAEPDDAELRIIYSSGTPQMQTAWLLLVNAGLVRARLFRAEGQELRLDPLFEDQLLAQACRLFAAAAFRSAEEAFENLAARADAGFAGVARDRRTMFHMLAAVAASFHHWSGFEYAAAHRCLTKTMERCARFQSRLRADGARTPTLDAIVAKIGAAVSHLARLRAHPLLRVADVYCSAHALCERGHLLDAVWRLEVAREQALVAAALAALQQTFEVDLTPDHFRDRVLASRARRDIIRTCYGGHPDNVPPHLRAEAALELLEALQPKLARTVRAFNVDGLRRIWWHTIHRAAAVDRNDAYRSVEETRRYLQPLVGDLAPAGYPLSAAALGALSDLFAAAGAGRL